MAVYLLPKDDPSVIIGFGRSPVLGNSADLVMAEHHSHEVEIPEHPVETGTNIADNVRVLLQEFTVDVWLTNSPITTDELVSRGFESQAEYTPPRYKIPFDGSPGSLFRAAFGAISDLVSPGPDGPIKFQALQFDAGFDRPREVQLQLTTYQKKGALFDVMTSTRTYRSMAIRSITMNREEAGGAEISIALKEVRSVSTSSVAAPQTSEARGQPKQAKGAQAGKDAGTTDVSLAAKAADAMGAIKSWTNLFGGG